MKPFLDEPQKGEKFIQCKVGQVAPDKSSFLVTFNRYCQILMKFGTGIPIHLIWDEFPHG